MTSLALTLAAMATTSWFAVASAHPPVPVSAAASAKTAAPVAEVPLAAKKTSSPTPVSAADPALPVFAVVPGGSGSPLGSAPKSATPRLVWTGFQVTDSGSRVFVQTTAEVELKVVNAKGGVTVTLHNCRVHMRNNSRMLDTRFFASPVQRIAVHQRRRDIQLDIALRTPAQSTPRQEAGPGGTHFWVIDFAPPAGSVSLK